MITYNYQEGRPDEVISSLRRVIGSLSRHHDFHQKVGLTNDPDRRWREYYARDGWHRMTVIYGTPFHAHAQAVERMLIDWMKIGCVAPGYYHNAVPGGEGRPSKTGYEYVYVVGSRKHARLGIWS